MHIAKCGGNTIRDIFLSNRYKLITVCDWRCANKQKCKKISSIVPNKNKTLYTLIHHNFTRKKNDTDFIFTTVRNPYIWYISMWSYGLLVGKKQLKIHEFRDWVFKNVGLYSKAFAQSCFDESNNMIIDYFIKLEDLSSNLSEMNEKASLNLSLNNIPVKNSSKIKQVYHSKYYTPELLELIYVTDREIFDRFNYSKNFECCDET